MDFASIKAITIPEGDVTEIKIGGVVVWTKPDSYKNWARYSTESDGTTIYNGGKGYKDGYRVRSGGAEAEIPTTVCTGFIPYEADDILRIHSNVDLISGYNSYINVYDGGKNCIGQIATNSMYGIFQGTGTSWSTFVTTVGNTMTAIIPASFSDAASIAFVRVTLGGINSGEDMVITVNEEIE